VDLNTVASWGRVASACDSPSLTGWNQRQFLFGLVVARRPERVFEIGFRYGGTSLVILSALQDNGSGRLVALDPDPEEGPERRRGSDGHCRRVECGDEEREAERIRGMEAAHRFTGPPSGVKPQAEPIPHIFAYPSL